MTITRIDLPDPIYQRAWSVANAAERATLLSSGDPRRGDIIYQTDTTVYYIVVETSIIQPLSGFAALPINLATGVTGTLADGRLSSNIPLKNGTNAFTGANSFATNLLDVLVGQIKFPATQNPSANANTLDDYEEGLWTPVDNSGAGLTFVSTTGNYVKIGRTVFIDGQTDYPVTANGAAVSIAGLPFTVAGGNAPLSIGYNNSAVAAAAYAAVFTNQIQIVLNPGSGVGVTNAQLSGKILVFGGFYRT